jgi:outer membrane protein assembly factor BamD (BamD/ComL family)
MKMTKPLSLCLFLAISIVQTSFAGTKTPLDIAKTHFRDKNYAQAEKIWLSVVKKKPGTGDAYRAQRQLAIMYLDTKQYGKAQVALDMFVFDFSGHADLSGDLAKIVTKYKKAGILDQLHCLEEVAGSLKADNAGPKAKKRIASVLLKKAKKAPEFTGYEQAKGVYEAILSDSAGTDAALRAQRNLVIAAIVGGNDPAAGAALDKLRADFASHANIARVMYTIGRKYTNSGQFDKARATYRLIVQQYPDHPRAGKAELSIPRDTILESIHQDNDTAAQAQIEKLIVDFSGHRNLPGTLLFIAVKYRDKVLEGNGGDSDYANVIALCEAITDYYPDSNVAPAALSCAGDCYNELGDHQKARSNFQKVMSDHSDFKYTWYAQFMIGRTTEGLKKQNTLSAAQADAQIDAAYQAVIDNYPDCPAAGHAKAYLSK